MPVGRYEFQNVKGQYQLGAQYRLAGTTAVESGTFYGGDKKTRQLYAAGGGDHPAFSVEPNISFNWLDLPRRAS